MASAMILHHPDPQSVGGGLCRRLHPIPKQDWGSWIAPYTPLSGSVGFDITILPSSKGTTQWMATYSSQGKIAKSRVL